MSDQLVAQREGLEKKDKTELQTIVEALGGNAPARMRKADLIDQILELSGASGADSDSARGGEAELGSGSNGDSGNGSGSSDAGSSDGDRTETTRSAGSGDTKSKADTKTAGSTDDDHPVGPNGEPLADWEVKVMEEGGAANSGGRGSRNDGRGGRNRSGDSSRSRSGGGRNDQRNSGGGRGRGSDGSGSDSDGDNKSGSNDRNRGGSNRGGSNGGGSNDGGRNNKPNNADNKNDSRNDNKNDSKNDSKNESDNDHDDDDGNRRSRRRRGRGRDRDDAGADAVTDESTTVEGYLDLRDEGYAFLRVNGFLPSRDDAYVSVKLVRQNKLRKGDHVVGSARAANRNEKNPALHEITTVNGVKPEELGERVDFDGLTPLFPNERLVLETTDEPLNLTTRIIDLLTPIGKGQRGLIVSPPKAGKTSIMKAIAGAIEANNPEVQLLVLLIDERPEEVTDMKRHLQRGEVVASTFDRPPEEHTAVAEITLERAKRMAEDGKDVVLIVDGITRLARAYNMSAPQTGRVLSGGIDAAALYPPKQFLGAARNVEEGGSLTMLATALVETGSKMDEAIFEECMGTANMELRLDRRLAERRIFPAIDVNGSSTRNEELLSDEKAVEASWELRRVISAMTSGDGAAPGVGIEMLVERLAQFKTNDEFLDEIRKS